MQVNRLVSMSKEKFRDFPEYIR